jgi:hypothetical protein
MSNPSLLDIIDPAYATVSLHRSSIPDFAGCRLYQATNTEDGPCLGIYQPDPALGARRWTINGKRILIAMYRDTGRAIQVQPLQTATWTRLGSELTITTTHHLQVGDEVNIEHVNVGSLNTTVSTYTSSSFTVQTSSGGMTTGTCQWAPVKSINFYDDYVVFRLLPSFRLIKITDLLALLAEINPVKQLISLPKLEGGFIRQDQLVTNNTLLDERGHAPVYTYDTNGARAQNLQRFAVTDNAPLFITQAPVNQYSGVTVNTRLYVYDFYGFELNDNRAPFGVPLITYNANNASGLHRETSAAGVVFYTGPLYDTFGDIVVGALANNTLFTRKPVQPLYFDEQHLPRAT